MQNLSMTLGAEIGWRGIPGSRTGQANVVHESGALERRYLGSVA